MCEPISATTLLATTLALNVAQTTMQAVGQNQQAKAQRGYQSQLVAANNAEANNALSMLRIEQAQTRESNARELQKAQLASKAARSTAIVAAGEAGVTGNSVDAMLQEYSANLGAYKETALRQQQIQESSFADRATAIRSGARYDALRINAPVSGANVGAALAQFGGQALGAYRDYNPGAFQKTPSTGRG